MFKRFLDWIQAKIIINQKYRSSQINEGEVYWCSLGENIGDEENGKGAEFSRPVLILKKFNNNIFLGIPMSTKNKESKYYVTVRLQDSIRSVIISQIRILDTKRLMKKIAYIPREDFVRVQDSVIRLIKS
jgi:mRNA interferase MazF